MKSEVNYQIIISSDGYESQLPLLLVVSRIRMFNREKNFSIATTSEEKKLGPFLAVPLFGSRAASFVPSARTF